MGRYHVKKTLRRGMAMFLAVLVLTGAAKASLSVGVPRDVYVYIYVRDLNGRRVSKDAVRFTQTTKDIQKSIAYKDGKGIMYAKYSPTVTLATDSKCTYLDFEVSFIP